MSERNVAILLNGIITSFETIIQYTSSIDLEEFKADQKTRDAVLMQLLIIGGTANRIPANFRKVLPDVEWGRIIRSRHIIAYEYHGIDYEVIWKIITVYLPALKESIQKKLSDL